MNNSSRTAWTVAGVLAILLIIMTIMWGRESGAFGGGDLAAQRDRVAEACRSVDDLDSAACRDALEDLARLLGRFERRLERQADDVEASVEVNATTSVESGQ